MCKDVGGMIWGNSGKCEFVGKLCQQSVSSLYPALFSKVLFKKALANVFVDV